jgi:hypothetical protein
MPTNASTSATPRAAQVSADPGITYTTTNPRPGTVYQIPVAPAETRQR